MCPFCVISTACADGQADASPRGDPPGFVAVADERTLLVPDGPGNNQIDSLPNIAEQPRVDLLFFAPGMNETLRVKGIAEIVTEPRGAGAAVRGRQASAFHAADHGRGGIPALRQGADPVAAVGA